MKRLRSVPAGAKLFRKKFEQKLKGANARGSCEIEAKMRNNRRADGWVGRRKTSCVGEGL